MDIKKIRVLDTIPVVVADPDGGPDVVFTLAGPAHPVALKADQARADAIMKQRGKINARAMANEYVAARVIGWEGLTSDGEPLVFSPEAALSLLSDPNMGFLRDHLQAAIGDNESFYKSR